MNKKSLIPLAFFSLILFSTASLAQIVRFETSVGNIDFELYPNDAPVTVQNFLNYVNQGDYDGTVIHRHERGFVIQGGGYTYQGNGSFTLLPTDAPIQLETNRSNLTGTLAMARTNDPDSATNQWFVNLTDNTFLDTSQGGYAVFGEVVQGQEVIDLITSLQVVDFRRSNVGTAVVSLPAYGFSGAVSSSTTVLNLVLDPGQFAVDNVVEIKRAFVLSDVFQINAGLSGAWFNPATNGQGLYLEVLPNADTVIVGWYTFDDEVQVVNGKTVGDVSNRWLTAAGSFDGNTFVGNVFKTSGGLFDDPQTVSVQQVGSMSIVFNDCATAVFSYELTDSNLANTMNIQRISGANVASCEALADAANPGIAVQ